MPDKDTLAEILAERRKRLKRGCWFAGLFIFAVVGDLIFSYRTPTDWVGWVFLIVELLLVPCWIYDIVRNRRLLRQQEAFVKALKD